MIFKGYCFIVSTTQPYTPSDKILYNKLERKLNITATICTDGRCVETPIAKSSHLSGFEKKHT